MGCGASQSCFLHHSSSLQARAVACVLCRRQVLCPLSACTAPALFQLMQCCLSDHTLYVSSGRRLLVFDRRCGSVVMKVQFTPSLRRLKSSCNVFTCRLRRRRRLQGAAVFLASMLRQGWSYVMTQVKLRRCPQPTLLCYTRALGERLTPTSPGVFCRVSHSLSLCEQAQSLTLTQCCRLEARFCCWWFCNVCERWHGRKGLLCNLASVSKTIPPDHTLTCWI